jgi:hypothetical protein
VKIYFRYFDWSWYYEKDFYIRTHGGCGDMPDSLFGGKCGQFFAEEQSRLRFFR